jgi:hypothetical protein
MSNELKSMQTRVAASEDAYLEPAVQTQRIIPSAKSTRQSIFYLFSTCSVVDYYIESPSCGGLNYAMNRLKSEFGVDANKHCSGCNCPKVVEIKVVPEENIPEADGVMIFVAR